MSIRALEVFVHVATGGSLQHAANALGLSPPAASQQLRGLEQTLGYALIDREHRPLEPTPAGRIYLWHAREALKQLRQGALAVSMRDLTQLKRLRLAAIDDLDGEVTPRLAVALASALATCELSLLTAASHEILDELQVGALDFGVAARPIDARSDLVEAAILHDPFVIAVPRGYLRSSPKRLNELESLAYLRYGEHQLMGRQIAAELAWRKIRTNGRIVLDSNQVLFALIADGQGWAVTTPLGFSRVKRFQQRVDLHPLPFADFGRVISLFHTEGWQEDVSRVIAGSLRESLQRRVVEPMLGQLPWLAERFRIAG